MSTPESDQIYPLALEAIRRVRPRYQEGDAISVSDPGVIDEFNHALQDVFDDSTLYLSAFDWFNDSVEDLAGALNDHYSVEA